MDDDAERNIPVATPATATPSSPYANAEEVDFSGAVQMPDFLTKREKEKFVSNQGGTAALSKKLCSIFEIPEKNIEVSKASTVTGTGIMMYVVHFINTDDIGIGTSVYDVDIGDIKRMYKKNAKK